MKGGNGFRLPTEAEWEYAARAGGEGRWSHGNDIKEHNEHAWHAGNSDDRTHPVGQKKQNAWGLFDMHGNVLEWCSDWYGEKLPGGVDPVGPTSGSERSRRSGGWGAKRATCRSATRGLLSPDGYYNTQGFRLAAGRSGQ